MEMLKAFIHIKITEQHKYNSNIGCVLIYLQNELYMLVIHKSAITPAKLISLYLFLLKTCGKL